MNQRIDRPETEQIPEFPKVLDDMQVGNNVFLLGSAGTGKTTLAEAASYAHVGRKEGDGGPPPFKTIKCTQWTSPTEIIGGQTMDGYREGVLIECWVHGLTLILDEMPKLDPNTAGLLNDPIAKTAKSGAIITNGLGEPKVKHPNFSCIATGNILGKGVSSRYVGNNKQDASLLDRFSGAIYHIGFNEELESAIIYPQIFNKCKQIRDQILLFEGKDASNDDTEDIMTLRTMLNLQRIYELEMMREIGMADQNGKAMKVVKGGKTLKDAFESYFLVMNQAKAKQIWDATRMESFCNSYKGKDMKTEFTVEYKKRFD